MEPEALEEPPAPRAERELPNGTQKAQVREPEKRSKLSAEELSRIEDEEALDRMLDQTTDFEERRLIRTAMRELRQRKRDQRERERSQQLQELKGQAGRAGHSAESTSTRSSQVADGSARSTLTKTERLVQSSDGTKTSRTTTTESSYVKRQDNGSSTLVQTKSSYSSSSKKTGSIFDREDESASRQSSLAALERRQAEKKKELMKAQSLPKTSTSQARKAMVEKLQKEGGSAAGPGPPAPRTPGACGSRGACAGPRTDYVSLVFSLPPPFPDWAAVTGFPLSLPCPRKHADCPQLLDVEDMIRMREPDWKCVYTYIQEFYRCLVQKGLVKTKKS
ncbi:SMTN protein, partial [Eudromia elegans]|nr:SMTN protein [Eudromia elegans]